MGTDCIKCSPYIGPMSYKCIHMYTWRKDPTHILLLRKIILPSFCNWPTFIYPCVFGPLFGSRILSVNSKQRAFSKVSFSELVKKCELGFSMIQSFPVLCFWGKQQNTKRFRGFERSFGKISREGKQTWWVTTAWTKIVFDQTYPVSRPQFLFAPNMVGFVQPLQPQFSKSLLVLLSFLVLGGFHKAGSLGITLVDWNLSLRFGWDSFPVLSLVFLVILASFSLSAFMLVDVLPKRPSFGLRKAIVGRSLYFFGVAVFWCLVMVLLFCGVSCCCSWQFLFSVSFCGWLRSCSESVVLVLVCDFTSRCVWASASLGFDDVAVVVLVFCLVVDIATIVWWCVFWLLLALRFWAILSFNLQSILGFWFVVLAVCWSNHHFYKKWGLLQTRGNETLPSEVVQQ